jgi:hypothetical protein
MGTNSTNQLTTIAPSSTSSQPGPQPH